jgi:hypothetical protein
LRSTTNRSIGAIGTSRTSRPMNGSYCGAVPVRTSAKVTITPRSGSNAWIRLRASSTYSVETCPSVPGRRPGPPSVVTWIGGSLRMSKTSTLADSGSKATSVCPSIESSVLKWLATPSIAGSGSSSGTFGSGGSLPAKSWTRRSKGSDTTAVPPSGDAETPTG